MPHHDHGGGAGRSARASAATPPAAARVASIDAFRGFVMFLMLAEAMRLWTLHEAFPASRFWAIVAFNTTHVPWQGCSLHDLIQPAFSFLVGAALPFSIASRRGARRDVRPDARPRGLAQRRADPARHLPALARAAADLLDVRGHAHADRPRLHVPVPARVRVAARAGRGVRRRSSSASGRRSSLYPLPPAGFDYTRSACPPDWPHLYSGFLAHFNKNSNLSWAFDVWFLNLFPREAPFLFNDGGWSTLSFIPTLATMMLGHVGGRVAEDVAVDGGEAEGPRSSPASR